MERENERIRRKQMRSSQSKNMARSIEAELNGYQGGTEAVQKAMLDLQEAGVTDEKLIKNTIKAEYKMDKSVGGKNHEQFVDLAMYSQKNKLDKNYFSDEDKRKELEDKIDANKNLKGNDAAKKQVANMLAEMHGESDVYKKHSRWR